MKDRKYNSGLFLIVAIGIGTLMAVPGHAQAQRNTASHVVRLMVAEVAVLGINDPSPLDLVVVPPALKNAFPAGKDRGVRILHYTTVNGAGTTRSISVSSDGSSAVPAGTSLRIVVTGIPEGCGTAASEVTVDGNPKRIITDIPTSATGRGALGAVLQYRFVIEDESSLVGGAKTEMKLVYTITES
jgi:hypothetical protein